MAVTSGQLGELKNEFYYRAIALCLLKKAACPKGEYDGGFFLFMAEFLW